MTAEERNWQIKRIVKEQKKKQETGKQTPGKRAMPPSRR